MHFFKPHIVALFFILVIISNVEAQESQNYNTPLFEVASDDFIRKEKNLRKWDAPTIADLDQDGYPDLVLNDHGLGISICWNNKGVFTKPYDVLMGDLHGVSAGDINFDGNIELIVSRGGGSGDNARNAKMFTITNERIITEIPDFNIPLEKMRGRTLKFFDGDNDGDLDLLNFAFPSSKKDAASENYIYKNDGNGQLILNSVLPPIKSDGQKTLLTDFNGDGILDVLLYGHKHVKTFQGKGDLTFVKSTNVLPTSITDVTAIAEIDFDNDGDFDLYLSRGKEFEIGETFYNKESQTLGFFTKRGYFKFNDLLVGAVLNMQNFQSQWPYNDAYYIGETAYKYAFSGETHSGKDIRLVNSDALGFPDQLKQEGGIHIGYVGNDNWRIAGNTWSPTTGTITGVLAYDEPIHSEGLTDVFLENRNGKFIDITKKMHLDVKAHTVGVAVADIDNNGYQDIIVVQRGNLVFTNEALLYLNHEGSDFSKEYKHGISTSENGAIGMAVEAFDYDLDGDVDIILGNERGKWHLFKNILNTSINKAITITVKNAPSGNATALGALVKVKSCNNQQMQRIGSTGANYALSFNPMLHFGIEKCSKKVDIEVIWSNKEKKKRTVSLTEKHITIGN